MGLSLFFYQPSFVARCCAKKCISQIVLIKYLIRKMGHGQRFFLLLDSYSKVYHLFSKSYRRLRRVGLVQVGGSLILREFIYKKKNFNFFQFISLSEMATSSPLQPKISGFKVRKFTNHFFLKRFKFRLWRLSVKGVVTRITPARGRRLLRGAFKSLKFVVSVGRYSAMRFTRAVAKLNVRHGWARMSFYKRRRLMNSFFKVKLV